MSGPMRILFVLPVYGRPVLPNGAAITSAEYAGGLAAAGHQVDVVTTVREPGTPRTVGGVRVWPLAYWRRALAAVRPELLVSHQGDRKAARITSAASSVPHLLMVHGMADNRQLPPADLVWFPSQACRDHYPYAGPSLVLPPPIDPGRYRTGRGGLITLNGATDAKGADVLASLAARLPDERFLMVRAAPGTPAPGLPNVEVIERADPRSVYARTRLLLMPSAVESYGRVGIEAGLSGIPVIAAPLPGIREALGDCAAYVGRDDLPGWAAEIERLADPETYAAASASARAHADVVDYPGTLRAFEEACRSLVPSARARRRAVGAARPVAGAAVLVPRAPEVVAWIHYGVPYRQAGSETMLHTMMRAVQDAGRSVLVVCSEMPDAPPSWQVDRVPYVQVDADAAEAQLRAMRPRVVVTHHHFGHRAVTLAREIGARSVLVLHNDHDQPAINAGPDLCVYNTQWIAGSLAPRYPHLGTIPGFVVHPPVIPAEHRTAAAGRHVTLVNLNRDKGVETWRGASRLLPRLPFLGVTGAHGQQHTRPLRANIRVIGQTTDMRRDVWARTRVLLAPSIYESYGMAAVEALASGIPVIAHPTPGLREALGDAATFLDRGDTRAWADAIRRLHADGSPRAKMSAMARGRSAHLDAQTGRALGLWVDAINRAAA
ncbi:glycosyltransferase family 4 protein [Streptomyces sp. NPDC052179]|uniref:glycosyltransferase family 4 protein n=1 Tax=Streptomyces sp. NPDC052179 TaxID=3155680 RepID=UPI0034286D4D